MLKIPNFIKKHLQKPGQFKRTVDIANHFDKKLSDYKHEYYAKSHSAFTTAIHVQLCCPAYYTPAALPTKTVFSIQTFDTEKECMDTAAKIIEDIYKPASNYFLRGHYQCIATLAANYYSKTIYHCLEPLMNYIRIYADLSGRTDLYDTLYILYSEAHKRLLHKFNAILMSKLHKWPSLAHFTMQIVFAKYEYYDIEERHLYSPPATPPSSTEYMYLEIGKIQSEMEQIMYEIFSSFFKEAYTEYLEYIAFIERVVEKLIKNKAPYHFNESPLEYLQRLSIMESSMNNPI